MPATRRAQPFAIYAPAVAVLLAGYMFFGRPFAYLHVPGLPVFPGEVVLGIGLVEGLRHVGAVRAVVLRSAPLRCLVALLVLGGVRLVLELDDHGLDAVRDSALVYYALNAVLVGTALRLDASVIRRWLHWYEHALPVFLVWAPVSVLLDQAFGETAPFVPDSVTPITQVKVSDVAAFSAIAISYLWLRPGIKVRVLERYRLAWSGVGLLGLLVAGTQTRGGLLAGGVILGVTFFTVRERARLLSTLGAGFLIVLLLALTFDVRIQLRYRELSVEQIGENLLSLVQPGAVGADEGDALTRNVSWRTDYWQSIIADNLVGDDALVGQGWGQSLATTYDLQSPGGEQDLRNAHNSHLSVLGFLGLPGLLLWLGFWCLLAVEAHRLLTRMRHGSEAPLPWLLGWVWAALVGILFNAVFDPNLEGPQVGIWTWVLAGIATQAVHLPLLAGLDAPVGGDRPSRGPRLAAVLRRRLERLRSSRRSAGPPQDQALVRSAERVHLRGRDERSVAASAGTDAPSSTPYP